MISILKNLREIVDELAAAQTWQADLRHVESQLLLYRALVSALEAESVDRVAAFDAPTLPEVELLYPAELRESLHRVAAIATRARGYAEATSPVTRGRHLLETQEDLLIANPVVGEGFVGREDIVRRLEELWAVPGQRPSVVLYGHRRMGKSSILQNLHGEQFDAKTRIVDFNLQTFGLVPSTAALLHNLALELHDACVAARGTTDIAEPDAAPFDREPYGAFKRFLRRLDHGDLRFIVTMDEFETLEELIRGGG